MTDVISPLKAIKIYCIDCSGGNSNVARTCHIETCVLHPFRLGKNPFRKRRIMTEEQKKIASDRLKKAREARNRQVL